MKLSIVLVAFLQTLFCLGQNKLDSTAKLKLPKTSDYLDSLRDTSLSYCKRLHIYESKLLKESGSVKFFIWELEKKTKISPSMKMTDVGLVYSNDLDKKIDIFKWGKALDCNNNLSENYDEKIHELSKNIYVEIKNFARSNRLFFEANLNPSYLRGDFNNDNKTDIAVMIRKSNMPTNRGILIYDGNTNKCVVLGAGNDFKNLGDDFAWIDYWYIYEGKKVKMLDGKSIKLKGEGILLENLEIPNAKILIFWNGKEYSWIQIGDEK